MDQEQGGPSIRVLIAAPFPDVVGIHERMAEYADELEVCGVARHAESVVEQTRLAQPDVLVLAEQPGIDAADTASRLAAIAPTTRVIVLAGTDLAGARGAVDAVLPLDAGAAELRVAILAAAGRLPQAPAPPAHARAEGGDVVVADGPADEAGWLDEDAAPSSSWPPSWLRLHPDPEEEPSPVEEMGEPVASTAAAVEEVGVAEAVPPPAEPELDEGSPPADQDDAGPVADEPAPQAHPDAGEPAVAAVGASPTVQVAAESAAVAAAAGPAGDAIAEQPRKRVRKPGRTRAETVLVFSGKGGVGKSVVATNLAVALSLRGAKVALIDLNLQYGDVAVLLHVEAHPTSIESLAQQGDQIDADFLDEVMAEGPEEIRVLLAPSSPEFADLVTGASVRAILRELSRAYDYVVVDSPAHLEERVLEVMEVADQILVVTSFNITSVKDTKITLKLLQSLGIERERVAVVLNQVRAKINFPRADIESSLRFEVLGQLPYDPRVDDSIDTGRPMVLAEPRSEFAKQLNVIVDYLAPEESQGARTTADDSRQRGPKRRFGLRR